jgi:predicted DNA-binding protein
MFTHEKEAAMASTTVSIRMEQTEKDALLAYADLHGKSVSDTLREALFEKIEDELDLHFYEIAKKEYDEDPTTYTFAEVGEMLRLR